MISFLITLLVFIVVAGILFWLVQQILANLPLPPPIKQAVQVIFLLICLLILLGWVFGGLQLPHMRAMY